MNDYQAAPGLRNNFLFERAHDHQLAGNEVTLAWLSEVNRNCCFPPLPEMELEGIIHSVNRLQPRDTRK